MGTVKLGLMFENAFKNKFVTTFSHKPHYFNVYSINYFYICLPAGLYWQVDKSQQLPVAQVTVELVNLHVYGLQHWFLHSVGLPQSEKLLN